LDEARAAIEEVLRRAPASTVEQQARISPISHRDHRERYLDGLRKAGLP
jgi:hypothetical protein